MSLCNTSPVRTFDCGDHQRSRRHHRAYRTGRGRIYMRARSISEDIDKSVAVADRHHELPYQLNKARLIERSPRGQREEARRNHRTARRVRQGRMRVVIELRRGEVPEVILNNLYAQTQLQSVFGINIVALMTASTDLNLKDLLEAFVSHRREVVTAVPCSSCVKRASVVTSLKVKRLPVEHRPVIALQASPTPSEDKEALIKTAWESSAVVGWLSVPVRLLPPEPWIRNTVCAKAVLPVARTGASHSRTALHRLTSGAREAAADIKRSSIRSAMIRILNSAVRLMEVIRRAGSDPAE